MTEGYRADTWASRYVTSPPLAPSAAAADPVAFVDDYLDRILTLLEAPAPSGPDPEAVRARAIMAIHDQYVCAVRAWVDTGERPFTLAATVADRLLDHRAVAVCLAELRGPIDEGKRRVFSPRPHTGEVAGVWFRHGVGETDDPAALAYFERRGYDVEGQP